MHDVEHAGVTTNTAQNLAERIMTGKAEIAQLGLTMQAVRNAGLPAEMVRARIASALAGANPSVARACLNHARSLDHAMSRILLDVMAHGRCDAAAWLTIMPHVDWVNLPGPMGGRSVITRNDRDKRLGEMAVFDTHVDLGDGVTWLGENVIDISMSRRELPETVMEAARGRALRGIVSHPALDRHPLIIEEMHQSDGYAEIIIRHRDMPLEDLCVTMRDLTRDMLHPHMAID